MISLQTLGSVDLRKDGAELSTLLAQPKRLALLAYLASARPRGFHSRDTLLALFWPEAEAERARNSLRQALHHLRRSLGEDAVPGRGEREVGVEPRLVQCDAAAFDEAVEGGRWEDALALYRGDFLPGLFVQDAPEAERWIEDERARRRRDAVDSAWRLAESAERVGELAAAERWAHRAVALEPSDEGALRRLLSLLERAGDPAAALAAYDEFARRLEKDYALAPSPETMRLVERLRAPAPTLVSSPPREPRSEATSAVSPRASSAPPASVVPVTSGPTAPGVDARVLTPQPLAPSPEPRPAEPRPPRRPRSLAAIAAVVVALAAGGVLATYARARRAPEPVAESRAPTIAVLPFVNMSGDPANDFLSDGISEELLNLLAQVPGLQVAARTSSFTFKGQSVAVDSIGRALHVRHVLEGSVRQAGPRVRITAQLIDAATGFHLWSGTFDSRVEDVVAVQDSIGRQIVERLRPQLAGDGAPERRETADPEARIAVLKGWRAFRQNTREGYEAAVAHFREAIRRDSTYGRAYGGLATVRSWQAYLRFVPQDSGYAEAAALASRALALDSSLTEAHAVLGRLAEERAQDFATAEAHYRRAIAINPSESRAYGRLSALLARTGRAEEGLSAARRAVELDPASPAVYSDLAHVYDILNRFRDEEQALRAALSLDPCHPVLLGNLATTLMSEHRFAEAETVIAEARRRVPRDANLTGRHAYILARLGRADAARAALDTAETLELSPVHLAASYAVLGDRDRAFALLDRALRERDDQVVILLDPSVVPELRDDARMQRIMDAVRKIQPVEQRR